MYLLYCYLLQCVCVCNYSMYIEQIKSHLLTLLSAVTINNNGNSSQKHNQMFTYIVSRNTARKKDQMKKTLSTAGSDKGNVWAWFDSTDGTHTNTHTENVKCQQHQCLSLNSKAWAWNPQTFSQFCFSDIDKKNCCFTLKLNMIYFEPQYIFI